MILQPERIPVLDEQFIDLLDAADIDEMITLVSSSLTQGEYSHYRKIVLYLLGLGSNLHFDEEHITQANKAIHRWVEIAGGK